VVGRLPVGLPPEARRDMEAALRGHPGMPMAPPAPGPLNIVIGGRHRGLAAVTAELGPPAPGARRVAWVALRDGTGRPDFARLVPAVDRALRAQLAAAGFELTSHAVAAVARRERAPDALVADLTKAGAVLRGVLDASGDADGTLGLTVSVFDARRGRVVAVDGRVPFGHDTPAPALADALAASVARGVNAALGGVTWGSGGGDGVR
jgi:hypothetical protein